MILRILVVTLITSVASWKVNAQEAIRIVDNYAQLNKQVLAPVMDDQIYVINFWATWCAPCVKELPHFFEFQEKYPEIKMTYVSLDFNHQIESKLNPFIEDRNMKEQTILFTNPDEKGWISKVNPKWSGAIPITIIKQNDKFVYILESIDDSSVLERELQNFM